MLTAFASVWPKTISTLSFNAELTQTTTSHRGRWFDTETSTLNGLLKPKPRVTASRIPASKFDKHDFGSASGDELVSARKARPPLGSIQPPSQTSLSTNGPFGSGHAQTGKPHSVGEKRLSPPYLVTSPAVKVLSDTTTSSTKLSSTTTRCRTPRPAFEPASTFDSKPRSKDK